MMLSAVGTDYFQTIHNLFKNRTFCDLMIITTGEKINDGVDHVGDRIHPIFCHSIVLCAALPELKSLLSPTHFLADDYRTLILDGYDRQSIQAVIDDIYSELVSNSGTSCKAQWLKSFDLFKYQDVERCDEHKSCSTWLEKDDLRRESFTTSSPFDPSNDQYITIRHLGEGESYTCDNNDFLGTATNDAVICKEIGDHMIPNNIPGSETLEPTKPIKITKKIKKCKLKEKIGQAKLEKVCFGCLKSFPFSTSKERKWYLKHTLTHCKCNCDILFKSKVEFEKHMRAIHKDHVYKCDYLNGTERCNGKSTLLKEYIRHRQKHVQCSKEESNICPDCGREFINSYYMKAHYGSRHKKMKCQVCGIYTYGTDDNQKHHNAMHKPKLVCELCGKDFKTKSTLRCHVINVHTPEDQRPYKCSFCPKGFLNSRYLLTHVERDHKGNRAFKCRAIGCDRTFTLPEVRKRHEKRDHNININLKPGVVSKFEVRSGNEDPTGKNLLHKNMLSTSKITTKNL